MVSRLQGIPDPWLADYKGFLIHGLADYKGFLIHG
jgi:hypothetical protein